MDTNNPRAFVQMAYNFGSNTWNSRYESGKLIGINEPYAYGFHRAGHYGFNVVYSHDRREGKIRELIRKATFAFFGFDLVHVWRNRRAMLESEVVWAFTESQSLAVLFVLWLLHPNKPIKTVLQVTYLFDRWGSLSPLRRYPFLYLLRRCSVLVVLSPLDREFAQKLLPNSRIEVVRFGINVDGKLQRVQREISGVIKMVSAGNDRRRDWKTLIAMVRDKPDMQVTIISQNIDMSLLKNTGNIKVVKVSKNAQYLELLDDADLMLVTTSPNIHTCGLTVIQEAVVRNIPVVCSDTGGLRAYFSAEEIAYVPPADAATLEQVVRALARNRQARTKLADNAATRMSVEHLSSESYARAFADLSR